MRQRKFIRGERLTVKDAVQHILDGRYIFQRDKPLHSGWAASWPLSLLRSFCAGGNIYEAKINPEYKEKK